MEEYIENEMRRLMKKKIDAVKAKKAEIKNAKKQMTLEAIDESRRETNNSNQVKSIGTSDKVNKERELSPNRKRIIMSKKED